MEKQKKNVSQILRDMRKQRGLTQQAVTDMLGLKNKSTLATWECGKSAPDAVTFLHLCCIYGLPEAKALVDALSIIDTAEWNFSAIATEYKQSRADELEQEHNKKPYIFCPYCGEKLE